MDRWAVRPGLFFPLIACATGFVVQPYRLVRLSGISMQPTYKSGEFVLATTRFDSIAVGDVVVVDTDSGPIIKRVARVPGDQFVEALSPFGQWYEVGPPTRGRPKPRVHVRVRQVPPGCIYVLGDNLDFSSDSREFGWVPLSRVRAKLVAPRSHDFHHAWLIRLPSSV